MEINLSLLRKLCVWLRQVINRQSSVVSSTIQTSTSHSFLGHIAETPSLFTDFQIMFKKINTLRFFLFLDDSFAPRKWRLQVSFIVHLLTALWYHGLLYTVSVTINVALRVFLSFYLWTTVFVWVRVRTFFLLSFKATIYTLSTAGHHQQKIFKQEKNGEMKKNFFSFLITHKFFLKKRFPTLTSRWWHSRSWGIALDVTLRFLPVNLS